MSCWQQGCESPLSLSEVLALTPILPVLVIDRVMDAEPLVQTLQAAGLRVVEVTLRTDAALDAVTAMRHACPDLIVGTGTVLDTDDADRAVAAGSQFLVSPGATPALLKSMQRSKVPVLPGVATLSEIMVARDAGFSVLKFFPAESLGGVTMLRTLMSVIPEVSFCPTGGIEPSNIKDYLALPNVVCIGGSFVATRDMIIGKGWQAIRETALASLAIAQNG